MSNVNYIIPVRASSWGTLFDCAYRFEGEQLLGMTKRSSGAAHLGTSLHHSTAVYDAARVNKLDVTVDDAAGAFVSMLRDKNLNVDWSDVPIKDAERVGLSLHTRYCTEWSPRFTYRTVEMELKPLDIDVGGVTIKLTGKMDRARVRVADNKLGITDLKSGKRAVESDTGRATTKGHAPQGGVYELLFEHTTGERIEAPFSIVGLQTTKDARIGFGEISGARDRLVGTEEHPGLIEMAAQMLKSGIFPPNPRSQLCSERYCVRWKTCPYHD